MRSSRRPAPDLMPKTWYGMPAYARDGKVVCFFRDAGKFKERYAMLGFNDTAKLDARLHVAGRLRADEADRSRRGQDPRAREEGGELDERDHRHHPERARDPRRADLRRTARARLLRLDRPEADPGMVGRRHGRRGDGRPSRRHVPLPHRLRRRRGRVPRGRRTRAARADVPEPPADARVRGSGRPDEADADDALRDDRGARHDHAVRRRGRSKGGFARVDALLQRLPLDA